ncbi:MAG: branched-chain amino acid ABC transporter permease [Anaerolineales bacterium]|nr:branched-chain amino acid ABC transporter permease [Anaerolineales bacterium]
MSAYQSGLIIQVCISIMTVVAVFAMTGLAGMFSLGQAAYMAVGAYVTFVLYRYLDIPYYVTGLLAIMVSIFLAWLIGVPTLKLRRDFFALLTVGFSQMVVAVILLFEKYTNGSIGFSKIPRADGLLWVSLLTTTLIIFWIRNLKYSRFGRMCIALKNDEVAARSFGIDVYKLKLKIYILASAIAAFAGILMALRNRVITPDSFGWASSAEMQIFLFFGGTNSLTGAVLSASVLKLIPEFLRGINLFGTSLQEYRTIIYCIMIIIVINFRPQGILGEIEFRTKWIRKLFSRSKNNAVPKSENYE